MSEVVRKPCPSCPWRVDQEASAIPNFRLDLAESLAACCPDEHGHGPSAESAMFGCHLSRDEERFVCAGWLAMVGNAHPRARLAVAFGQWPSSALRPGDDWPEMHDNYTDVLAKLRGDLHGDEQR